MKKIRFILIFVCLALILTSGSLQGFAMESPVEDAVLKGNWEEVFQLLEKDSKKAEDPIAKFMMGHACLATNRNNASLLIFLSVKNEGDIELWSKWTDKFLKENPQNPFALYFSADAKARTGKLEEAKKGFTRALQIKRDFALAYSARGVIHVLTNKWDNASIDFTQSIIIAPNLADAHANLGTYRIFGEVAEGAKKNFNQAIKINPEFALAYNGRGCAYFGKGEFEKAAQNYNIASQLNPILVVAEINQGLNFAYSSQIVSLGSIEKKPGSTLEFQQQCQEILKHRQQKILDLLPTKEDHDFWKKMDALPWILQYDDKTHALVEEYGFQRVQAGAFLKMQEYKDKIAGATQKGRTQYSAINSYNRKIWNLHVADYIISLIFTARGTVKDLKKVPKKGWNYFALETERRVEETVLSSISPNSMLKTVIDALPSGLDPVNLGRSIASSGSKMAHSWLEDKLSEAQIKFESTISQVPVWGAQLQAIQTNLGRIGGTSIAQSSTKPSSQIPGYYTSIDRPLTDLGALASMADKSIKPTSDSARNALIVSQDPFRTNLLQSELNKYGFQTNIIPSGIDTQIAAKQWSADVILGIRGETRLPQKWHNLPHPSLLNDDNEKKFPPPPFFPPEKGGAGAVIGIPQQNWDWGKSFVPAYPEKAPGGYTAENLARSFVDKGNWPVMTLFGLVY